MVGKLVWQVADQTQVACPWAGQQPISETIRPCDKSTSPPDTDTKRGFLFSAACVTLPVTALRRIECSYFTVQLSGPCGRRMEKQHLRDHKGYGKKKLRYYMRAEELNPVVYHSRI